jgi:anti-sigma factor RsiW
VRCNRVIDLTTDFLEDVLSRSQRRRVVRHLADCPVCAANLEQTRALISSARNLVTDDVPEELMNELVALYRRRR